MKNLIITVIFASVVCLLPMVSLAYFDTDAAIQNVIDSYDKSFDQQFGLGTKYDPINVEVQSLPSQTPTVNKQNVSDQGSKNIMCQGVLGINSGFNRYIQRCDCLNGYIVLNNRCVTPNEYCRGMFAGPIGAVMKNESFNCACQSGYYLKDNQCLIIPTKTNNPVCSANSHQSPNDPTKCICDKGFNVNSTGDGCVSIPQEKDIVPTPVLQQTQDQWCRNQYGIHGISKGPNDCQCDVGYKFNSNNTVCVVIPQKIPVVTPELEKKVRVPEIEKKSDSSIVTSLEEIRAVLKIPGALRECPKMSCKVIRYYAETAEVSILNIDSSGDWYQVKAGNGDKETITGWMGRGLFTGDFRDQIKKKLAQDEVRGTSTTAIKTIKIKGTRFWSKIWSFFDF